MAVSGHFIVERGRERRRGGPMRLGISWLDIKLGIRMLARYPGLSFAALAVSILPSR